MVSREILVEKGFAETTAISCRRQRCIQDSRKYLRWSALNDSQQVLAVNYFREAFHLKYLQKSWVRIWTLLLETESIINNHPLTYIYTNPSKLLMTTSKWIQQHRGTKLSHVSKKKNILFCFSKACPQTVNKQFYLCTTYVVGRNFHGKKFSWFRGKQGQFAKFNSHEKQFSGPSAKLNSRKKVF